MSNLEAGVRRELALHVFNPNLILRITSGPQFPPEVIPEYSPGSVFGIICGAGVQTGSTTCKKSALPGPVALFPLTRNSVL